MNNLERHLYTNGVAILDRRLRRMVHALHRQEKISSLLPGIGILFDTTGVLCMRIFWSVLFLLCIGLCNYQTVDRVLHYLSWPITVDVHITQSATVQFPQVTICNEHTTAIVDAIQKIHEFPYAHKCLNEIEGLLSLPGKNVADLWQLANASTDLISFQVMPNDGTPLAMDNVFLPYGICLTLRIDTPVPFEGIQKRISLTFTRPPVDVCVASVMKGTVHDLNEPPDPHDFWGLLTGSVKLFGLNMKKYHFVSHPKNPCSDTNTFWLCMESCKKRVWSTTTTCRFPFQPRSFGIPDCVTSPETRKQFDIAKEVYLLNPEVNCSCGRACEQTIYEFIPSYLDKSYTETHLSLYFRDNIIPSVKERFAYDFVALLCDIGGNLGFYLGLSLLSICELQWKSFQLISSYKTNKFSHSDPIYKKVTRVYQTVRQFQQRGREDWDVIGLTIIKHPVSLAKRVVCSLLACTNLLMCLFFLFFRIHYYFSRPSYTGMAVNLNTTHEIPTMTICFEGNEFQTVRNDFAKKHSSKSACDISLLDLLDHPSLNATYLWETTDINELLTVNHEIEKTLKVNVTRKLIHLPLGICTQFLGDSVDYTGNDFKRVISAWFYDGDCKKDYYTVYLTPPGEEVDLTKYRRIPVGDFVTLTVVYKVNRISPKFQSCYDMEKAKECKRDCLVRNLFNRVDCRLPYMPLNNSLPFCSSSIAAKQAEASYMKLVFSLSDTTCGCLRKCEKVFYDICVLSEPLDIPISKLGIAVYYPFVEVTTRNRIYKLVNLICDVGGLTGLFLGASVLTLLNALPLGLKYLQTGRKKTTPPPHWWNLYKK